MPPSRWVIVTCTTGFSWGGGLESSFVLTKIFFCPAIGGRPGPPCLRQWPEHVFALGR